MNDHTTQVKDKSALTRVLEVISGSFGPIIGVLAGAGLLKAALSIFSMLGWLSPESGTYIVLNAAAGAVFHFLPVFLGISIAIKLGANGYVGGVVGAALLTPGIVQLVETEQTSIDFLGIPLELADYSSTVFPIFLAMFVYAGLDKVLKKVIYKEIQMFINPLISLLIIVPLTLLIFGPIGNLIGEGLGSTISFLISRSEILAGLLLGAAWTFLTIAGLHWTIIPLAIVNTTTFGEDPIIPLAAAAPFAQIGIAIAVFLKTKDKELKALAASGFVPGALAGTTEAINYGIILRYKKTMIYAAIAGGIGGAINGVLGVVMKGFALPSLLAIPIFTPMGSFVIGITVAFILGFLMTYFIGYENKPALDDNFTHRIVGVKPETIQSPLHGKVVPLTDVVDPLFSTGSVGKGIAIEPESGQVVSPIDGEVTTLFPSKHAIGITSKDGAEVLIFIGVDTINLKGQHFTAHVKQGDKVKQGDLLIDFDIEAIKESGYKVTTPIVITNTEEYVDIAPTNLTSVKQKDNLLKLSV
ncbi:PTS beta-glucoside transporter subunit EIIBCA [Oceanobacillus piezotolerans]|uniref:PTS beta-glucoside transporter subunit EIIBCA n=1 Tax=Oceanobacillus piezotolerans TaxID=2448030 RepID=A0A498D8A1_9BACI|nr:glucose PTS transporter subunit IIA [Oceanobacillus piezotolerans]RLL44841.1 PTS beta-glucoside transporter subunit EIIBCA [Oceanobacillus piezotolerans]